MRNMRGKLEHILEGRGVREGSLTKRRAGKPRRQTQTGFRGVLHTWVRYGWATRWSRPSSAASSTFGLRSPRHSSSSTARVLTPRFPPLRVFGPAGHLRPKRLQRRLEVGVGPRRGVPVEKDSLPAIKAYRSALQDGLALLWRQPGLPPPEHLSEVLAAVAEETIPVCKR